MNNYDHTVLGVGNPNHPANQEETQEEKLTFTEYLESELNEKYFKAFFSEFKAVTNSLYQTNKKIAEIEQSLSIFGTITSDERIELHKLKKELTDLILLL